MKEKAQKNAQELIDTYKVIIPKPNVDVLSDLDKVTHLQTVGKCIIKHIDTILGYSLENYNNGKFEFKRIIHCDEAYWEMVRKHVIIKIELQKI